MRLDEALLQLVAFAGYGRAITAFAELRICLPVSSAPKREAKIPSGRGERICRRIYGPVYGRMMDRMRDYHPTLARWILGHGYGQVLSRSGLLLRERELLAAAVLGALRLPVQQESHLRGARRCGASPGQIRAVLRSCGLRIPQAWA